MNARQVIKPLIAASLRRLRWQLKETSRQADWLAAGGEAEAALLPQLCDRHRVSIDIGANLGGYTWLLRPLSKRVVAFEANPDLASRLVRACILTLRTRVTVHNVALSDQAGMATLRVPTDHGRSTIEAGNALVGRETRAVEVPMRRLDDYPPMDIGFIKIDVEGHELAVLRGAERQLRASRPNLLIEATDEHRPGAAASVAAFLVGFGYRGSFLRGGETVDIRHFDPTRDTAQNFVFVAA